MLTLPTPPLTVADLDEFGLDDPRLELVDGMLVVRPWPTPLRTRVTQRLARLLAAAAPDGEVVAHRVAVQINERTELSPDIVVTGPIDSDHLPTRRVVERPRLVIDVAEAANRRFDRTVKLDLYRERGIPACWLVGTEPASIEAWQLSDDIYVLAGRADGQEALTVTVPFPVTIIPAGLVVPPELDEL